MIRPFLLHGICCNAHDVVLAKARTHNGLQDRAGWKSHRPQQPLLGLVPDPRSL